MRITVLVIGSRGDVQPLLALAAGLQRTGRHKVRVAAPDNFVLLAREHNLDYFPLGVNTQDLLGTGDMKSSMETGRNFLPMFLRALRTIRPLLELLMERTRLACQDAEMIVFSTIGIGGYHVAEKQGVPCCLVTPIPGLAPTRAFPSPSGIFPRLHLGGGYYNLLTYHLSGQLLQVITGSFINRWRREQLDLPAIPFGKYPYTQLHGHPVPVLGSYSSIVVPRPSEWGEHVHVTGYWFLDPPSDWQPPAQLVDFLKAGSPPVYIGFGSMANRSPQQTTRLVLDALERSGQRGVLATGWGGLDSADLPVNVFALASVPHAWLFPHMSAVVHHGGSGTTGAGLRAGVPSVLVPHIGDQSFWAQRVTELGVGPSPIPRHDLTAQRLTAAITHAVTDAGMQSRAAALGERIRAEDGIGRAVEVIEHCNQ